MSDIANTRTPPPAVNLHLVATTIPEEMLPVGPDGERLFLPTTAKVSLAEGALIIEAKAHTFDDTWDDSLEEAQLPTVLIPIPRADILQVRRRGRTLIVAVRDPLAAVDELTFTFASQGFNNPEYWVKVLIKLIREGLGVAVEESED